MQFAAAILIKLLKTYLIKLGSEKFVHWALFQMAEAVVSSTETKEDDKWLAKIKATIEEK